MCCFLLIADLTLPENESNKNLCIRYFKKEEVRNVYPTACNGSEKNEGTPFFNEQHRFLVRSGA